MNSRPQIKDADGEIAALVYSAADRPDLVLAEFATHTARSGKRIAGLIQFREHPVDGSSRKFLVLQSGQMIDIAHHRDTVKKHLCHVDEYWLTNMVDNVCTLITDGIDAVIVNRFGRLEEEGRGFCDAITVASEAGTPLVIAVPDFELDR
jgi:hypothetical protein